MDAEKFLIKGKELEALMKDLGQATKIRSRKPAFKVRWIKLPVRWVERLRGASSATYNLALTILIENFKLEQMAVKEIVLSTDVTGLSKHARRRAVNNLTKLGLIRIRRRGKKTIRVIDLYI
jgi:hypothetical protein